MRFFWLDDRVDETPAVASNMVADASPGEEPGGPLAVLLLERVVGTVLAHVWMRASASSNALMYCV